MPPVSQPRGGFRRLNVLSCVEGFKSTNTKGPFTLYNIECADPETGIKINAKFNSFAMIPLGVGEYQLKPYMKDGVLQSWTIEAPKGTQSAALAQRTEMLEERVKWCEEQINGLLAIVQGQGHNPQPLAAGPTGNVERTSYTQDDDIPF